MNLHVHPPSSFSLGHDLVEKEGLQSFVRLFKDTVLESTKRDQLATRSHYIYIYVFLPARRSLQRFWP